MTEKERFIDWFVSDGDFRTNYKDCEPNYNPSITIGDVLDWYESEVGEVVLR